MLKSVRIGKFNLDWLSYTYKNKINGIESKAQ